VNKPAPRKRLPVHPSLEHLQKQAKRLAKQDPALKLSEAQQRLARDYGCKNWAELSRVVEAMRQGGDQLANVKREIGPLPKAARDVNMPEVRRLLEEGNYLPLDLDRALAHALWYGPPSTWPARKEIADLAMEYGADPDAQYGSNYGPTVFGTGECIQPEGLQYLVDAGADVTFAPIETKYGKLCPLDHILGTYARGENERKHRYIDILLKHGGFIPGTVTPPILAIHRGDTVKLAELLEGDPDLAGKRFPDMPYGNIGLQGGTLLHCAVEFGEMNCVKLLLDHHADINAKSTVIDGIGGQTPIFHAISSMGDFNVPLLEYLIGRVGQWIDWSVKATFLLHGKAIEEPVTPMEYALRGVKEAEVNTAKKRELELLRRADRKEQVKEAIRGGDLEKVTQLLDAHPEFLDVELWPVTVYEAKSLPVTKLLLERRLDPNQCSAPRLPLHLAVYQVLPEIVEALVRGGADADRVNKLGERPLELLDAYEPRPVGDPEVGRIKEILVQAGARMDFLSAVRMGDVPLLEKLLAAGEVIPPSALHAAARSGRVEVARLLLAHGANPDEINAKKNTPLWFAAQSPAKPASNRIAVMKLLLDAGADIHRRCEDGTTVLHFAAWRGPVEEVEFLLSRGARNWLTDDRGKKPLDYAQEKSVAADKEEIVALFSAPRVKDPNFKAALRAMEAGDLEGVKRILAEHPYLATARAEEEGWFAGPYFKHPYLLEFVAENPIRTGKLPGNICAIAQVVVDAFNHKGHKEHKGEAITKTLGLVASGSVARECGVQVSLLELLVKNGADATEGLNAAVMNGEMQAAEAMLRLGAKPDLVAAAGLGLKERLVELLDAAGEVPKERLGAILAAAIRHGHWNTAEVILDRGFPLDEEVQQSGTALHHAAWSGHRDICERLIARGADLKRKDRQWQGTAADWARHGGHAGLAEWLSREIQMSS